MLWQQALSRRLYKFVRFIIKYSNSTLKYSSLFTFRPEPPVFIGIPRGEELFVSLHPLFTTLHRSALADLESAKRTGAFFVRPKVKSGEEWVKSARTLFTPRNAHKHRGFGAFGEE